MFVSSSLIKSEGRSCFACLSESMGLATCHYLYRLITSDEVSAIKIIFIKCIPGSFMSGSDHNKP
jgi:hypothetical protein